MNHLTTTWTPADNEPEPLPMSDEDIREASDEAFLRGEAREFVGHHETADIDAALADPSRVRLTEWLATALVDGGIGAAVALREAEELAAGFAAEVRGCDALAKRREHDRDGDEADRDRDGNLTDFCDVDVDTVRGPGVGHTSSDFGSGKAA